MKSATRPRDEARDQYRALRYPGDLAADVADRRPARAGRRSAWRHGAAAAVVAIAAGLLVLALIPHRGRGGFAGVGGGAGGSGGSRGSGGSGGSGGSALDLPISLPRNAVVLPGGMALPPWPTVSLSLPGTISLPATGVPWPSLSVPMVPKENVS